MEGLDPGITVDRTRPQRKRVPGKGSGERNMDSELQRRRQLKTELDGDKWLMFQW